MSVLHNNIHNGNTYCLLPVITKILFFILLLLFNTFAFADEIDVKEIAKTLDNIEKQTVAKDVTVKQLTDLAQKVTDLKGKSGACISKNETLLEPINKVIEALGEPVKNEPAEIRRKRQEVQKKHDEINKQLAACRVLRLRSEELVDEIQQKTNQILAQQLFAKGPSIYKLLKENWNKPSLWFSSSKEFLTEQSGLGLLSKLHWIILGVLLAVTIGAGVFLRRYLCNLVKLRHWDTDFPSQFLAALITSCAYYAPHLLASTAAAILLYQTTHQLAPIPFITVLSVGLPPLFAFMLLVRLLLSPPQPAKIFLTIPEKLAHSLARRLRVLALLTYLGYLFFATLLAQSFPEPALLITRAVFATILALNLLWALGIIMKLPSAAKMRALTYALYAALIIMTIIEWAGYRNLSLILAKDVLGTLFALGVALLLARLFHDLYESLETGNRRWSYQFRNTLGIQAGNTFPGIIWLRLTTSLAIWLSFAYVVLLVWDVSETIILDIRTYLSQGFLIGSLRIVPAKIASALLAIGFIVLIGGWMKNRLEATWLKKTRMERGSKEAMVTITGYLVFIIAFLVGLGVAGFEFGNIAIIAGALSVGIGFGLQNIVNNFISGLILLFERPVKTGDWVVVGNTEGYVKRIRIRSTQIQTFDRADVIVPNSELISNQVTNWMLRDPSGRIRIPVGVAYGSNTEQVKEVLLKVTNEHPRVIKGGNKPEPKVLFLGFGDSSLNFEIRCYVMHIDERLQITSDINFAIDAAFRENNIEIPFPQRDIHIRSNVDTKSGKEDDT